MYRTYPLDIHARTVIFILLNCCMFKWKRQWTMMMNYLVVIYVFQQKSSIIMCFISYWLVSTRHDSMIRWFDFTHKRSKYSDRHHEFFFFRRKSHICVIKYLRYKFIWISFKIFVIIILLDKCVLSMRICAYNWLFGIISNDKHRMSAVKTYI